MRIGAETVDGKITFPVQKPIYKRCSTSAGFRDYFFGWETIPEAEAYLEKNDDA